MKFLIVLAAFAALVSLIEQKTPQYQNLMNRFPDFRLMPSTLALTAQSSWNTVLLVPLPMVSPKNKLRSWRRTNLTLNLKMSTATSNVFSRRWICLQRTNSWLITLCINCIMVLKILMMPLSKVTWNTVLKSLRVTLTCASLLLMCWSASRQRTPKMLSIWRTVLCHMITLMTTHTTTIMHTIIKFGTGVSFNGVKDL